ncbi:putative MFS family arabinose efflux permease [Aminobacter niigataensis]|uniref:MFS family arabinose efflux permease n=1 Tax=Aminobacter niigataensis TaxID=83265 RepID=A0ABR6L6X0_9HYPH|nr:MFS transporter [Aminobacter niigataensis]MBB4652534.1 putative MFS family arabinose efflux permease [Aminobacter niigataensis]
MHTTSSAFPSSTDREGIPKPGLSIFLLAVAAFLIVTTEYIILGILPALSRDLDISISTAGQLVTLFAFTVMLFGPPLTAALSHLDRKQLFIGILLVFVVSNAVAAVAPNIWVLAAARFTPALFLPVFWGTASETAGQLAGQRHSGRAVSKVYLGISAALVFGIPLGTIATNTIGWRGTFWVLAVMSLAMAIAMAVMMQKLPAPPTTAPGTRQAHVLRDKAFLANVLLSVFLFTAMFTAYTYLADMLERLANIAPKHVGWWLMGFGAVGMLGNWLGGRMVDKAPLGASMLFAAILAVAMLAFAPLAGSTVGLTLSLVAWGVAYTALFPICQVRVMKAGAGAQALAGTINVSAANAGTGLGAIFGGLTIDHLGLESVGAVSSGVAAIAILVALAMSVRLRRLATA